VSEAPTAVVSSEELAGLWAELLVAPSGPRGLLERRLSAHEGFDIFAAVSRPGNDRALVIRIPARLETLPGRMTTRSVDVSSEAHGDSTEVYVRLTEPSHADVFAELCRDLIRAVNVAQDHRSALLNLVRRLGDWRRLLEELGDGHLGRERQRGLYAELWFLLTRVRLVRGPAQAVTAWVGPTAKAQDFHLGSAAVELKATGAHPPFRSTITSERQLDDSGLSALFLVHVALDEREGLGERLNALVDRARGEFVGSARDSLDERLVSAGYLDAHRSKYTIGYAIRGVRCYRVRDGFPRITERGLPGGVGSVRYLLTIDACDDFSEPEDAMMRTLACS
jgi:hypothetical protein